MILRIWCFWLNYLLLLKTVQAFSPQPCACSQKPIPTIPAFLLSIWPHPKYPQVTFWFLNGPSQVGQSYWSSGLNRHGFYSFWIRVALVGLCIHSSLRWDWHSIILGACWQLLVNLLLLNLMALASQQARLFFRSRLAMSAFHGATWQTG
jgi:hypothetical protein